MRIIGASNVRVSHVLVPVLATLLLGCGSSKGNGNNGAGDAAVRDAVTGNNQTPTLSVPYVQGEMAGQTAFYDQLTPSLDKSVAALIQAVFTVNTFLFTDPAVTSFETFQSRKAEADQALDVLVKYSAATVDLIDAYTPSQDDGGLAQKADAGVSDGRVSSTLDAAASDAGASDARAAITADAGASDARVSSTLDARASDAGASDARAAIDGGPAVQPMRLKPLSPDEVLATVSSGPANQQIKTLMKTYNVNAKRAQLILNTAMAGLDAQAWQDAAKTEDTLMRQATLVKETAELSLTVVGTVATAGGVSGSLGLLKAAAAIIDGTKGAIAVSKAGLELAVGKDLNLPNGSKASLILTTVSTVSDIIAIQGFHDIADKFDVLNGVVTIASKVTDGFVNKTINVGTLKVDITDGLSIGSSVDLGYINSLLGGPADPPSTLPGTYKIKGVTKVVPSMPGDIINAITKFLPKADTVKSVLVAIITPESPDAGTPDVGKADVGMPQDAYISEGALYFMSMELTWGTGCASRCTGSRRQYNIPRFRVAADGQFSFSYTEKITDTWTLEGSGVFTGDKLTLNGKWSQSYSNSISSGSKVEAMFSAGSFSITASGYTTSVHDGNDFSQQTATISYSSSYATSPEAAGWDCTCSGDGKSASVVVIRFFR